MDLGDILLLIGTIILLTGLYFIDWRFVLIVGGCLMMAAGVYRLRVVSRGGQQ